MAKTNAEYQAEYREREKAALGAIEELLNALVEACERGRSCEIVECGRIADTARPLKERLEAATAGLKAVHVVAFRQKRRPKEKAAE